MALFKGRLTHTVRALASAALAVMIGLGNVGAGAGVYPNVRAPVYQPTFNPAVGKTASRVTTTPSTPPPVASGPLKASGLLAFQGSVYTAALPGHTYNAPVTVTSSDGTTVVFTEGIATTQPGVVTGTYTGTGTPYLTITETVAGVPSTSIAPITVVAPPSVPSASVFTASADKILAAYNAKQGSIAVSGSPATITTDVTAQVPSRVSIPIDSVPDGYSGSPGFGNNKTQIYANTLSGAKQYARGASKRFHYAGRYVDLPVGSGTGLTYLRVRTQPWNGGAGGTMTWATAAPYTSDAGVGGFVTVDLGSYSDRIVELIDDEFALVSFMGAESGYPVTAAPNTAPRVAMFNDSYIWGQGADEARTGLSYKTGENIGVYDIYAQGYRTNAWARFGGSIGAHPFVSDRLLSNPYNINELTQFGTLDLVVLTGTLNDNTSNTTQLYNLAKSAFQKTRRGQPTALIVFTLQLAGPDARGSTGVLNAYRNAFNDALGSDPGAIMLDTANDNWIPATGVGSTAYFPSGASGTGDISGTTFNITGTPSVNNFRVGDTIGNSGAPNGLHIVSFSSGTGGAGSVAVMNRPWTLASTTVVTDTAHPIQAGHTFLAGKIADGIMSLVNLRASSNDNIAHLRTQSGANFVTQSGAALVWQ